jgi:hypothetical protein
LTYDINKLPDSRGRKRKYPWDKLQFIGDHFIWKDLGDRAGIVSASRNHNMKVSVRKVDNELHVIRIK